MNISELKISKEYQSFDTPPNHADWIIIKEQNGIEFEHWFMSAHLSDFQCKTGGVYNYNSLMYCKKNNTYHGDHLFSQPCNCSPFERKQKGHYDRFYKIEKPFMWRNK